MTLPDTAQMVPAPSSHLSGADICERQPAKNMSNIKIYFFLKVLKWIDSWRVVRSSCDILLCQRSSGVTVKTPCVVLSYCPGQTLEDCHRTADASTSYVTLNTLAERLRDRKPKKPAKLHWESRSLISHIAPYFEISAQTLSFMSSSACLRCWFFFFCHEILYTNAKRNRSIKTGNIIITWVRKTTMSKVTSTPTTTTSSRYSMQARVYSPIVKWSFFQIHTVNLRHLTRCIAFLLNNLPAFK